MCNDNTQLIISATSFYRVYCKVHNHDISYIEVDYGGIGYQDIFYARIVEKAPLLNGFFLNIGVEGGAFLKYHESNSQLHVGDHIIVQVVRTHCSSRKSPVMTSNIKLVGALCIYSPCKTLGVYGNSLTTSDKERLMHELRNELVGSFVIRESYCKLGYSLDTLLGEIRSLYAQYTKLLQKRTLGCLFKHSGLRRAILLDTKTLPKYIVYDSHFLSDEINDFIYNFHYLGVKAVIHDKRNLVFDYYHIFDTLDVIKSDRLSLPNTMISFFSKEAFNYIDLDFNLVKSFSAEKDFFMINMGVTQQIVRQIILKNLSGQIFIDLLKVNKLRYRKDIMKNFKKYLSCDYLPTDVCGFSHLGLLEISRKKIQPSLPILLNSIYYYFFNLLKSIEQGIHEGQLDGYNIVISKKDYSIFRKLTELDLDILNRQLFSSVKIEINDNIKIPKLV